MATRLITPSQLSLFSISPVIGAWWEELHSQKLYKGNKPAVSELDQQLFADGLRHEQVLLNKLENEGHSIARLPGKQSDADYAATREAMARGVEFIHQASLCNEEMRGSADLLKRIDRPSLLGEWSYIPIECKLASKPKTTFLVQASAYCELLTPLLGHRPDQFELYLGGGKYQPYGTDQFWAWYQLLRQRYRQFRESFDPSVIPEDAPGDHGSWTTFIEQRLEDARDLMLVAGMRQNQRQKLRAAGISTIEDLAAVPGGTAIPGLTGEALHELRQQAELQLQPVDADGRPAYRLRPIETGKGLAALPAADAGDIWFDMEGIHDPVSGTKLEYLFGACYRNTPEGKPFFKAFWAHSEAEEKLAFEGWVDWVEERRRQFPGLRIYHYAAYEKTAMRRLAQQHATREAEIDSWLRGKVLVDLLPTVTSSIVLGEPSYSIKKVEHLYMDSRQAGVTNAGDSVVAYLHWQNSGEPAIPGDAPNASPKLQAIEDYNREDCESTVFLHDWLLKLRREQGLLEQPPQLATDEEQEAREPYPLELLSQRLLGELPDPLTDPEAIGPRGLSWRAQQLLAQLLPFHHREAKVDWWAYFDRKNKAQLSPDELIDDSEAIASALWTGMDERPSARTGADIHHFRFDPSQPLKLHGGDGNKRLQLELPDTGLRLDVAALDAEQGRVSLKFPWKKRDQRIANGDGEGIPKGPTSLIKKPADISKSLRESLAEQAEGWVDRNQLIPASIQQLLESKPLPALKTLNDDLKGDPKRVGELLTKFLASNSGISLALQGPPGTGKSTVTSQVIAQLAKQGKRIAICANSHPAINNLLKKAKSTCAEAGVSGQVVKCNNSKEEAIADAGIAVLKPGQLDDNSAVVGGTTWIFCREELADQFDLLVVDEAGQMSLANLLVMARCARSILLVGDQQQLAQPSQADHPGDSSKSCLEFWMQGDAVVPDDRGVFLPTSWRMEPSLTAMVSELFYEGRLQAHPGNCANCITWRTACQSRDRALYPGQGLVFEAVEHSGRSVHAPEEIDRIEQLVDSLLAFGTAIRESTETRMGRETTTRDPNKRPSQ
jgi:uncharacterized protein